VCSTNLSCKTSFAESFVFVHGVEYIAARQSATGGQALPVWPKLPNEVEQKKLDADYADFVDFICHEKA
jgi:hypothetical protein